MIWYALGGLIGLIFFKKKYNLSFWQALSNGVIFAFGLYFAYSAIISFIALILGLEEYMDISLLATILYSLAAFGSFTIIKQLKNKGTTKVSSGNWKSTNGNRYDHGPGDYIETSVAGVTFEGRQDLIKDRHVGQSIKLVREPENIHDENAIKVVVEDNISIGYINRDLAKKIAPLMDKYNDITMIEGKISSIYQMKNNSSIIGVKIRFQLPDKNLIK